MAYGKLKINTLTYDTGSGDTDLAVSTLPTPADMNAKANLSGATFTGDINLAATSDLRLQDTTGGEYVAFQAPGTVSTAYTLTMPADVGATGKVLKSTVSGQVATLTWETDSATDSTKMPLAGGTFTGNVNLGVNDTGVDCKFFGATAGDYLLWDESANSLLTGGGATIDIVKDKLKIGGTAVTTTAAELNLLDGVPAGLTTTEIGYLDGVTSAIQTQLDAKGALANDQKWTGSQRGGTHAIGTVNSGNAVIPLDSGNHFTLTAGGNVNIKFLKNGSDAITAAEVGQTGTILITNGGSHTPTWENTTYFAGGLSAAPTITASADTLITYTVIATNKIVVAGLSAISNTN